MEKLEESFRFDNPLPELKRRYPFGTNLAVGLAKAGHHVTVVVLSMTVHETVKYSSSECDVYIVPERRTRYQLPTLYRKEVAGLLKVVAKVKPDVILANWTYQYARAGVTSGFPCLVVARDSPWRCLWRIHSFSFLIKTLYSQFLVFPRIKSLSTISQHMVDDLRKFNRYKGEIAVIPNGITVDVDFVKDVKKEAKTIICVSEWNPLKNITTLFRAFSILRKRHSDWRLIAVGNCIDDAVAGSWMRKHGVSSDGIELLGRKTQDEIKLLLRNDADVFCSPTLEESFGQVFLEAMSNGVPCIGGEKSGAVPWVIGALSDCHQTIGTKVSDGYIGGVVCDVTKPEKLAECIERVMENHKWRKSLSDGGLRRVRDMFDIEKTVQMYEAELKRIASNH